MSFNHLNYKYYISSGTRKMPFLSANRKGYYVVTRNKKNKKWGFLYLESGKHKYAKKEQYTSRIDDDMDLFDFFVKEGRWVEVQVKNAEYQIV